jgi:hypothetical protein
MPGAKVMDPTALPGFLLTQSASVSSPVHQLTMPDGGGVQALTPERGTATKQADVTSISPSAPAQTSPGRIEERIELASLQGGRQTAWFASPVERDAPGFRSVQQSTQVRTSLLSAGR